MIKLESSNKIMNESFYFETIEDCERFKYVFENHWTGVKWKKPVEVSEDDVPDDELEYIKKYDTPEAMAKDNLSWAFNSSFIDGEGDLIKEQNLFVSKMIENIISN